MTAQARVDSFQVHRGDVRPLWEGLLHSRCVGLSPFAGGAGLPDAPTTDPDVLRSLAANPALQGVVAILADPDLRVDAVTGGGSAPPGQVALYRRRSVDASRVVAVTRSVGDAWVLHRFDDADVASAWLARVLSRIPDFVAWDVDTLAEVGATLDLPRQLPDDLPLEALLYLLHAIDMFRRVTYERLLAHAPVDGTVTVRAQDFQTQLGRALRSGDVRWLLPAFHRLMPGLSAFDVDPRPEHLEMLELVGILRGGRHPTTGEAVLAFGEVGARIGVEFYRTWHSAAAIALRRRGEAEDAHQWFLAPTAFTNHLFALRATPGGRGAVHHEALPEPGLARALHALLEAPVPR